jgi:hypothetical protein
MNLSYLQSVLSDQWYTPSVPHDSADAMASNHKVIEGFLAGRALQPDPGSPDRTEFQMHQVAMGVPLAEVVTGLLTLLRITRSEDSQALTGLLLQVEAYLDAHPEAICQVYRMSSGLSRDRSVDANDAILNLYQGAAPVDPPALRGSVYPGDREIKAPTGLTVQIHRLRVLRPAGDIEDVPTVAVWVPAEMAREWLVQKG